jgi:Ca2+-binding RTX toxin-like protein
MDILTATNRGPHRWALIVASALAAVMALGWGAPHADAATVDRVGSALVYSAGPGEDNDVQFSLQGSGSAMGIRVTDSGKGPIENQTPDGHPVIKTNTVPGCFAGGANEALCDAGPIKSIKLILGDGNDTVGYSGLNLPVVVDGGDGADSLSGMNLADTINGGAGGDNINAGGGDDVVTSGAGDDILRGGSGNDVLDAGDGKDQLEGEDGNDVLVGGNGVDSLDGGAGDDTLNGGAGGDVLHGGDGTDTVSYADRTRPLNIDVNNNPDDGEAGENDDIQTDVEVVIGGQGDDRIAGRDNGDAQTAAQPANDVLRGGPGDDTILGRGGDDKIDGGAGKDLLDGGSGADFIVGGADEDSVTYGARTTGVAISLDGVANDGGAGEGDNVASDIEELYGGAGDDVITGNDDRNLMGGQGGDDTLTGGGGDDVLNGGEGSDMISGGDGKDVVNYAWEDAPVAVSYDGVANDGADGEQDNLGGDIEGVIASNQGDRLLGGPAADFLYGYGGDDTLLGGPESDMIVGGEGNDFIQSMDGKADFVSCGEPPDGADPNSDADVALVDPKDSVATDCETKVVGTAVSVTTPARGVRAAGGALTLPLACQPLILDGCTGIVRMTTKVTVRPPPSKGTKHPKVKPSQRVLTIGATGFQVAPGETAQAALTLSKIGAALLAKAGKLTVTAIAVNVDAAGSRSTATQTFILTGQPPKRAPATSKHRTAVSVGGR